VGGHDLGDDVLAGTGARFLQLLNLSHGKRLTRRIIDSQAVVPHYDLPIFPDNVETGSALGILIASLGSGRMVFA
jgi:hypothetical protein